MIDAQAAGQAAAKPGVTCAEVNRACRQPIEEAGYGPYFRHRMGHCIGMDVHERPFISEEDQTPLEVGMTFTDEPSIMWHGKVGVRIENIVVCEDGGPKLLDLLYSHLEEPWQVLRLISAVMNRPADSYVANSEFSAVGEFEIAPRADVHFMMTTGYITSGQSALYVAETTTGKFGVYTMGPGVNGNGVTIRRHEVLPVPC